MIKKCLKALDELARLLGLYRANCLSREQVKADMFPWAYQLVNAVADDLTPADVDEICKQHKLARRVFDLIAAS